MDLAKSFDKIIPNNNRFKVLTDDGFQYFEGVVSSETNESLLKFTFEDEEHLTCTKDHQLYCGKDFKRRAKRLRVGDYLYTPSKMLKITNIEKAKPERTYDFLEVQPYNSFLLGKSLIKSAQCAYLDEFAFVDNDLEFYASTYPAISSGKDTKIIITSCVTDNTFVITDSGIKQVKDFIDYTKPHVSDRGYEIPRYNVVGFNKLNYGTVMVNNGKAETRIIKTTSTNLECSDTHKIWSYKDGEYKISRAHELSENDYIAVSYGHNVWGNNDDISDYLYVQGDKNNWAETNSFIPPKVITKELAYFMGLYLAEGCMSNIKGRHNVTITCGDDVSHVMKKLGLRYNSYDGMHYKISSKSLVDFMEWIGFDSTLRAKEKVIPKRLMSCSAEVLGSFLSGYYDGDGTIPDYKDKKRAGVIGCVSTSFVMIDQIRTILQNFGILSHRYRNIVKPTKRVKVFSVSDTLSIYDRESKNNFFKYIGFGFDRKQRLLIQEIEKIKTQRISGKDLIPHLNKARQACINDNIEHEMISKNIKWEKINSIEVNENIVYDFSLDHIEDDKWCHSVSYNGVLGFQTPNGLNLFYKMWTDSVNKANTGSTFVHYKVRWDEHPDRDEAWRAKTVGATSEAQFAVEFELSFQGSAGTLIDGRILENMVYREPILSPNKFTKVYAEPITGHKYVAVVDTSEGVDKDFSVINVIDVTKIPYTQSFVYRDNGIVPNKFANVVAAVGKRYNKALLLVESNNTAGGIVTHMLWETLEYENMLMTRIKDRENETGGGKSVPGIKTTASSRNKGCSFLKDLIESGQLEIIDYETINELGSFIKRFDKWEAERGKHDDIVMTLVIFAWFTAQNYFEEETGIDSNGKLRETLSKDEDLMSLMFFLSDGIEDDEENNMFGGNETVLHRNVGVPPNNYGGHIGSFFL